VKIDGGIVFGGNIERVFSWKLGKFMEYFNKKFHQRFTPTIPPAIFSKSFIKTIKYSKCKYRFYRL
jgi:hypothetical protein